MISSSTSGNSASSNYASQLQAYLAGGASPAPATVTPDKTAAAPVDSFVTTQTGAAALTYSAPAGATALAGPQFPPTIRELADALTQKETALADSQAAVDALRNVSIEQLASMSSTIDMYYRQVQTAPAEQRPMLLIQHSAAKRIYDKAVTDYFAYAQALNKLGIAAAEYQKAYERYADAIEIKYIGGGEPDHEGLNAAWLIPKIPKRNWVDTSYNKEVQSTELVEYGEYVTKTDTRWVESGYYREEQVVGQKEVWVESGHYREEQVISQTEVWVDTSHPETYYTTETVEYSYFSHTEYDTVHVESGHYEMVPHEETGTNWVLREEWETIDLPETEYGQGPTQQIIHRAWYEPETYTYTVWEQEWVDTSYDYEVARDVYATGTRTIVHEEQRWVESGHYETIPVVELKQVWVDTSRYETIPVVELKQVWVDTSHWENYQYEVYETGQRLVTTTTTQHVKAGYVEGTNIKVDGTNVSGSWVSSVLGAINRWVGNALGAVSAIGNAIAAGGTPSPAAVVSAMRDAAIGTIGRPTGITPGIPTVVVTGYLTPEQRLERFMANVYAEVRAWGPPSMPDWADKVSAITPPPVTGIDITNPLAGGTPVLAHKELKYAGAPPVKGYEIDAKGNRVPVAGMLVVDINKNVFYKFFNSKGEAVFFQPPQGEARTLGQLIERAEAAGKMEDLLALYTFSNDLKPNMDDALKAATLDNLLHPDNPATVTRLRELAAPKELLKAAAQVVLMGITGGVGSTAGLAVTAWFARLVGVETSVVASVLSAAAGGAVDGLASEALFQAALYSTGLEDTVDGRSMLQSLMMGGAFGGTISRWVTLKGDMEVPNVIPNSWDDAVHEVAEMGISAHKALRWQEYQARGGDWAYDRWANVYDANLTRATRANAAVDEYHGTLGWGEREVSVRAIIDGKPETRRIDIADMDALKGIEYKTGYQSLTNDNRSELLRDAALIHNQGWSIEWVFRDNTVSKPLLQMLDDLKIPYRIENP